jgi:hypothetical protein
VGLGIVLAAGGWTVLDVIIFVAFAFAGFLASSSLPFSQKGIFLEDFSLAIRSPWARRA